MTLILTHQNCLDHQPPAGHPESPARLSAVLASLKSELFQSLIWDTAPKAPLDRVSLAHGAGHIRSILEDCASRTSGGQAVFIDADTAMSSGSAVAALRAAGAVVEAVDRVMAGEARNVFCAVRPPGHHAERDRAMGFCLFNNIAVGALHARDAHKLERVAVIDFDVHHGNGTQDIFWNDANLFYASTHQSPLYPGTGNADETGVSGNIVNVPLADGASGKEFRRAMKEIILPRLETFAPQFIFISAGFDAHKSDPLAGLNFTEDDFAWATSEICKIAARCCNGRVVSSLEGGYDLAALGACAAAHVHALMEA